MRILIVTKDDGMPARTHAAWFYTPNLPHNEMTEDADIRDAASETEAMDG